MKRLTLILLLVLIVSIAAWPQQGNTVTIQFSGAPTGTCSNIMVAINTATGDYYNCLNGAWNKIATGGGAVISGTIAANQIPKGTAAGVIGASSLTDDATKVTGTIPFQLADGTCTTPAYSFTNNSNLGIARLGNNYFGLCSGGALIAAVGGAGVNLPNTGVLPFTSGDAYLNSVDTGISRDSAGVVDIGTGAAGSTAGSLKATSATLATSVITPLVTGVTTNVASVIQSGVDANTTGATSSLTVRGQNVIAGGSNNLAGGPLVLAAGIGTGTSTPATVKIQSSALGLSAAATQNGLVTRYVTHVKAGSTSSATPTTIFNIASAANTTWGVKILVHVQLISSTPNVCGTTQEFSLTGTNNNGAFGTVNINAGTTAAGTLSTLCSTGTLTLAVTATAANPSVISVTPTWGTITSITSATITVEIWNPSQQEITLL